jgi:hypothetical protein
MDGHQVTLATVTVESQTTSHNTKNNKKKRSAFLLSYFTMGTSAKQFRRRRKKKRFDCFFPHFFTSLAIYFSVIAIKAKKKERLFLHFCALLA